MTPQPLTIPCMLLTDSCDQHGEPCKHCAREEPDLTGPRCPVCNDTGCKCCPDPRPSA